MEAARAGDETAVRRKRVFVAVLAALVLGTVGCAPPRPDRPVIGAKNFTEQVVLGELLAQHIEARTGLKVDRRFYLAGSYICQQALVAGRIDGYVEYTGTALTAILKQPVDKDRARVLATVQRIYRQRYSVDVGDSLGFENTFAMIVRSDDAQRLHVATLSQAAAVAPQWKLGVGYEFEERPDGLRGLEAAYRIEVQWISAYDGPGAALSRDSATAGGHYRGKFDGWPHPATAFDRLADDRHYFPPYDAVPLFREEAYRRWPQMRTAVAELAGKITHRRCRR